MRNTETTEFLDTPTVHLRLINFLKNGHQCFRKGKYVLIIQLEPKLHRSCNNFKHSVFLTCHMFQQSNSKYFWQHSIAIKKLRYMYIS